MTNRKQPITVLGEEVLYANNHLTFVNQHFQNDEGIEGHYSIIRRSKAKEIIAVLVLTEKELIIMEQYRIPHGERIVEPIAGLVDTGYTLEQAVQKECLEEVGYDVQLENISHLAKVPTSSGVTNELIDLFIATDAKFVGRANSGEIAENINTIRIPFEEVMGRLDLYRREGRIIDPKISHAIVMGVMRGIEPLQKILGN